MPQRDLAAALGYSISLVLDNCEQIVGAASLIAEVVAACPRLTILATNRDRLHLRAEQRYTVPSCSLVWQNRYKAP